jgi:hypothetical protein
MSALAQPAVGNVAVTSGTTVAVAPGSNVTAGNRIIVGVGWGSSTQTCTVSGSINGALTPVAASIFTNASGPFSGEWFYLDLASGGAETYTATTSATNTQREIVVYELSGLSGPPDSGGGGTGSSTNPTGTITIVGQPGIILAYGMATAGTITVGATYTTGISQNGDQSQHKFHSATGSTSVPMVDGSVSQWIVSAVAFLDGVTPSSAAVLTNPFQAIPFMTR